MTRRQVRRAARARTEVTLLLFVSGSGAWAAFITWYLIR